MTDDEFVANLPVDRSLGDVAICIRRAIATLCHVHPKQLRPNHDTEVLSVLMRGHHKGIWDDLLIVFALEEVLEEAGLLGFEINDMPHWGTWRVHGPSTSDPKDFGDWVTRYVEMLQGMRRAPENAQG